MTAEKSKYQSAASSNHKCNADRSIYRQAGKREQIDEDWHAGDDDDFQRRFKQILEFEWRVGTPALHISEDSNRNHHQDGHDDCRARYRP